MTTDSITRVDQVLRDLRTLGAEIATFDFGHPVEEASFEPGAGDVLPTGHDSIRPIGEGFVALLQRIRDDWRYFLGADPESWTYLS